MPDLIEVDVAIVGAGPVGGTLACLLAGRGVRVAAIDRAALPPLEHPDVDGRAYAIAAGSKRVMEDAGLWRALPIAPGPIAEIRVTDGKVGRPASKLFLHFDSREAGEDLAGEVFGWMIEARSLRMAINRALDAAENLHVFAPVEAQLRRTDEHAEISIEGGPTLRAALVVAAEGRQSPLRQQAGIRVTRLPYHQTGMVGMIAHEKPHNGSALEHFLPAGPFAQLPMAGLPDEPNVSAFVWTERDAAAARMMALPEEAFGRELRRRMSDHLGAVRILGRRWSYPLSLIHAERYYDTRLALAGDAAHGMHPIAGQGLNVGFRDVAALGRLIPAALAAGEDIGGQALLRRYQAERRPDTLAMLMATDVLDRLFSNDNPALRLARDVGIAAVHRMPTLKRMFMRQAMGVALN
jgi:2-octaprenyl-6-methoxyphenol hydroxylase